MNVDNVLEMLEDEDFFFLGSDEEFYTSNQGRIQDLLYGGVDLSMHRAPRKILAH